MRRISILFSLAFLLLTACSPIEESTELNPQASLSQTALIGHLGEDGSPVFDITQQALGAAFISTFNLMNVDEFHLESEGYGYFLEGACLVDEATKVSFAIELFPTEEGQLLLAADKSTQSCTSAAGCKGCKLTKVDASSGYCDCIASNLYKDPAMGTCNHSISSTSLGGAANIAPLSALISNINS